MPALLATLAALAGLAAPLPAAADAPTTLIAPPAAHTLGLRRVTQRQLVLLMPTTRLQEPAGIAVARLAALDDPDDANDDDEVTIVALDREGGRLLTNLGLLKLGRWDGADTDLGPLALPTDVAIDRAGRVAVTDTGNGRLVLLHHTGRSLETPRAVGGFVDPRGIAADGRGGFYVCDRGADTVFRVDAATGTRSTFGLEVAFDRPVAVATVPEGDRMARNKRRAVVIVDRDGARLRSFGLEGSLRGTVEAAAVGGEGARFAAVDIDYYGNVLAVDQGRSMLHKFREDLLPLDSFGGEGTDVGQFRAPRGIAIHRPLGQVFITEADGGQYLWVGTDVRDFRAADRGDHVEFAFRLTEDSTLNVRILDPGGREIAVVVPERRTPCGPQRGVWDGTTAEGRAAAPGDYLAEVTARATYASRSIFERRLLRAFTLGLAPGGE